jgi:hypothetical protein
VEYLGIPLFGLALFLGAWLLARMIKRVQANPPPRPQFKEHGGIPYLP